MAGATGLHVIEGALMGSGFDPDDHSNQRLGFLGVQVGQFRMPGKHSACRHQEYHESETSGKRHTQLYVQLDLHSQVIETKV